MVDSYAGVACDGDAQGGTWCNENEDNCEDCGGNWCADESDSTIDNVEDVTQYENDGEYSKYMTDFEDLSLWLSGNFEWQWHWKALFCYSIPRQYCYRVLRNLVSGKQPSGILQ